MNKNWNMGKRILWAGALIFWMAYLLFWHLKVRPFDFSSFEGLATVISNVVLIPFFGSLLALFMAILPYRGSNYWQRFLWLFPALFPFLSIFMAWLFYTDSPTRYQNVETTNSASCRRVKTGVFRYGDKKIERFDSLQVETDIKTGDAVVFRLKWLSECEYDLSSDVRKARVKIVAVDEKGYDCYVLIKDHTYGKFRLQRLK